MKRRWTIPELIDQWALSEAERALVDAAREPHTRLGCACLLKYFQLDWRFPRGHADVPDAAIAHLAHQLGVPASSVLQYDWRGARPRTTVPPSAPSSVCARPVSPTSRP